MLEKQKNRSKRHKRIRSKIFGTDKLPRLCVFRSNKHIYAQLISDEKGKTLAVASDLEVKTNVKNPKQKDGPADKKTKDLEVSRKGKTAVSFEIGKLIAKKAVDKKIDKVVFDRGGYQYHGRVKALADGAREGGLKF